MKKKNEESILDFIKRNSIFTKEESTAANQILTFLLEVAQISAYLLDLKDKFDSHVKNTSSALAEAFSRIEKLEKKIDSQVNPINDELLNTPISELDFTVRTRRVLNAYNVLILRDLIQKTESEIYYMHNLGKTSLVEIKKKLDSLGLSLKNEKEKKEP